MHGIVKIACLSAALAAALVTVTENRNAPPGRRSSKGDRLDANSLVDDRGAAWPRQTMFAAASDPKAVEPRSGSFALMAESRDLEGFAPVNEGQVPDPL